MAEKKRTKKVLVSALLKAGAIIALALPSKYAFDSNLGNEIWTYLSGLF